MTPVDVADLLDHPGEAKPVALDETIDGIKVALAEVPGDAPVHGDLVLKSTSRGILVSGSLSAPLRSTCARCLAPMEGRVEIQVREVFAPTPGDEDYPLTDPEALDLEPMVRDAVVLALPFAPLCRPECLGLCTRCGGDLNLKECSCTEPASDPRWAVLNDLTFENDGRSN